MQPGQELASGTKQRHLLDRAHRDDGKKTEAQCRGDVRHEEWAEQMTPRGMGRVGRRTSPFAEPAGDPARHVQARRNPEREAQAGEPNGDHRERPSAEQHGGDDR